jgi:predicted transcriptional regulator
MQLRRKQPVNINLPIDVLDLLSAEATRLDRSRSWIIEQALRAYLAERLEPVTEEAFS